MDLTEDAIRLKLSLVIPVFNEAETVGLFIEKVTQVFESQSEKNRGRNTIAANIR